MGQFKLVSSYTPAGDQPDAIQKLTEGVRLELHDQVLLGVTGSGKTFTMAHVIANIQRPTLIISHNKTLAAQLYQEFRDFFPNNAVSYFVSYYDYYQPEAYIAQSDTYIEKETQINEEIDKLRLAATTNLLTRNDTIIVASVSCIYNIGSPREYGHFVLELTPGMKVTRESIFERLIQLQYERSDFGFRRGTFRVRGETIDIFPAYLDTSIRLIMETTTLKSMQSLDPMTGNVIEEIQGTMIYPAKHYMTDPMKYRDVFEEIRKDTKAQVEYFTQKGKLLEAHRIEQRVNYDLELLQEIGYINGVENYSRYFDGRKPGNPPYTLLDYYEEAAKRNWLCIIDESHMTMPQIRGMYNGDRSRKQTLIDYGFRLPSALDNRPLRFEEFLRRVPQTIYVSATPSDWEVTRASREARVILRSPDVTSGRREDPIRIMKDRIAEFTPPKAGLRDDKQTGIVEQLVRPTGLVDPTISIRPSKGQIDDLLHEIIKRVERKERVLVTTLTKRMAEDLATYLEEKNIRVHYLHSDIDTLKRTDILSDLRLGTFDVIVGINLLREGLDLPEVSLVAILDADKEGFLRNKTSLIQTMGRASRHLSGTVILYADKETDSIQNAVSEVERRRAVQLAYNRKYHITPSSISKPIRQRLVDENEQQEHYQLPAELKLSEKDREAMTPLDREKLKVKLTKEMRRASRELQFERAAQLRDLIKTLI